MSADVAKQNESQTSPLNPQFVALMEHVLESVDQSELAELRKDFHTRLRITQTQPENADLVQDLWDFFYDWCVFEQTLPERVGKLKKEEKELWNHVKGDSMRGLFTIQKIIEKEKRIKCKDLFNSQTYVISFSDPIESLGISKGDIIEGRVVQESMEKKTPIYSFLRRPSYHPDVVHDYIKKKVKQFKKMKDEPTYQNWLWVLVGMYVKHRLYTHMPVEKIYDDNSRI